MPRFALFVATITILCAGTPKTQAGEKTAATINGEAIAVAELDAALAHLPAPMSPLTAAQKRQQRADALQTLIDDRLVRQFLKDHGPKVPNADVERQFAGLEAGLKAEGKTTAAYLKEISLSVDQIKENFALMLSLAKHIEKEATDTRLKEYYETNRDLFNRTTVRVSHVVIRLTSSSTVAEKEKARAKLKAIRTELAAGRVDFPTAAKQHSQCPSGPMGGDLGFIARKFQTDEAFAKAAFAMKVGEVSEVVECETGFHLIWVTERKDGKATKYEDVATDVRECFEAEAKQNLLVHLRKHAKIQIHVKE